MKDYKFFKENNSYRTKKVFVITLNRDMSKEDMHKSIREQTMKVQTEGDGVDEFIITLEDRFRTTFD